jgi:hypothetical protein
MQSYLEGRLSIADLMTGWIHRDLGERDQLRNLFHPDATVEITWFAGKASDFVDGSMKIGAVEAKGMSAKFCERTLFTFFGLTSVKTLSKSRHAYGI